MRQFIKITLLLLALLLPATATAHDFEVDGIYYNINGNEAEVTYKGTNASEYSNEYTGAVTIPATVTYNGTTYSVTSISRGAFYNCSDMTSVNIPNSVTSIGEMAFQYCDGLTGISIPNSVTSIGNYAFQYCSGLISVNISNSVTSIGSFTFYGCSRLTSVNIPNSVTSIGEMAFLLCRSLTSITIPNSVTSIGNLAFYYCTSLTSITISNSVTSFGSEVFKGCNNLSKVFLTGEGEWTAGALPNTVTTLYVDNGITGITGINEAPSDVYSFAVTPPTCDEYSFLDYSGTLHVPAASLSAYFTAPYWCNFANIVGDAVKPDGISLDKDSIELIVPESETLTTTISPASATSYIIAWASSNPGVATIVDGLVTAVGHGECDIVALCADQKAVCHVTVYSDRISVDEQTQVLPNHMVTLTPTSLAAERPAMTVTSSDPTVAVARVMNGKVEVVGVSEGTATITVASADGTAKPATCRVTVYTEMGDTNGDGFIDVADVTNLIDKVLGNNVTIFKDKNGDLNNDGIMDVEDVTTLINTILGTN